MHELFETTVDDRGVTSGSLKCDSETPKHDLEQRAGRGSAAPVGKESARRAEDKVSSKLTTFTHWNIKFSREILQTSLLSSFRCCRGVWRGCKPLSCRRGATVTVHSIWTPAADASMQHSSASAASQQRLVMGECEW